MTILVERQGRVVIVRLNRPQALNALNGELMTAMIDTLKALDQDPSVGCFVITGNERAFAAGADIKEMSQKTYMEMFNEDYLSDWAAFAALRTPKIAAVSGYALGGGCELAMMCDIIYAADNAKFGQPEIKLGIIPGMGGTQRLTRLVGKAKATDLILTGRMMGAEEAERSGLVAQIFPAETFMDDVLEAADTIANYSKAAAIAAREAIDNGLEVGLAAGLLFERRIYHALFGTEDAKEGLAAFIEKRKPQFNDERRTTSGE